MGTNNSEGRMVNEFPIFGHFLFGISSAYGSIFRRNHRSFITHFPIFSTAIRLLFVFFVPYIILKYWGINLMSDSISMIRFGFWIGLSQADTIHYFLDTISGELKKY